MKNKKNWSGFFANMLGVILGIMLTFGVNALWQKHEEKKKVREMLILVRNELENNKKWFKYQEETLKKDSEACKKILEANKKWSAIPEDSLAVYVRQFANVSIQQMTTSAWQIFQNSEMIQKIPNKELIIRLTDCYFVVQASHDFIMKNYWDKKYGIIPFEQTELYGFLDAIMSNKEAVHFLQSMSKNIFANAFPAADAVIDYTLSLLDKYGDFRYDMGEKDKEFESFIQARMDSLSQK